MTTPTETIERDTAPVWDDARLDRVHDQRDKSDRVRAMFDTIAPTYERINTLFSFGRDRAWRRELVHAAKVARGDAVLDVACGTGDVVRAFERDSTAGSVVGADFSTQMLAGAQHRSTPIASWCQADAQSLPFADGSFDVVSCAFGVRNFQDLSRGFSEMHRVLRPGGRIVILEFTRPENRLVRAVHEFYSGKIMPVLAGWISRDSTGAYRYLPRSVVTFLDPKNMCAMLEQSGFVFAGARRLTFGVVHLYRAFKQDNGLIDRDESSGIWCGQIKTVNNDNA